MLPPLPTTKKSLAPPQAPRKVALDPGLTVVQVLGEVLRALFITAPNSPRANTLEKPVPQMVRKEVVVPVVWVFQVRPSYCKTLPDSPTAKTSRGPLPHTPWRVVETPVLMDLNQSTRGGLRPLKWMMVPLAPTAKMLVGPLPHTA